MKCLFIVHRSSFILYNAGMPAPRTPPSVSASVHIYRGIMDRVTTWRNRIDAPTNWAITTIGATASFVLNDQQHSHAVLILVMLLTFVFLLIEARRLRYYDLWASWLRLLETDYYADILRANEVTLGQAWERQLVRDLENPQFKVSTSRLVAGRLRDNYLALFGFLLACWLLKLLIHQPLDQGVRTDSLIERATIGPFPGVLVFSVVVAWYAVLVVFAVVHGRSFPGVELLDREQALARMTPLHQQPMSRRQSHAAMMTRFASEADDDPLKPRDWD